VKALAAHKNFALAAKALNVSQPSLTRSLKAIEKALGVQLIDRRGVTPTIFGEIVLRNGEDVLDALSELERQIDLARGLGMGELTVAAGPYPADISVSRAVGVLTARHPKLAVELRIADWVRVAADALESRIDLGVADITEAARDRGLTTEAVRTSRLRFFCAATHPLAGKKRVTLEDLLEFPWAGPSIPGRIRAVLPQVDKAFGSCDDSADRFHPRILVETFSAAKDIILEGQALGAAVKGQIDHDIRDGRLVTLPVEAPWLTLNYGFITKRGRTLSPAAEAFMEIVREIDSVISP
jgi:DNA-binding transcriptional LysR family regulator